MVFVSISQVRLQNVTRLCQTKSVATVNGKFPGPPLIAREGDRVVVEVFNHVNNNVTIHWYEKVLFFFWFTLTFILLVSFLPLGGGGLYSVVNSQNSD